MKHLLNMVMVASIMFMSCQSKNKQASQSPETPLVGADKDAHGCIASAGYTWSTLKDSCVRPFEQIQLDVIDNKESYQTAAFLIVDEKKQAAEVFVKESPESIVLKHVRAYEYENKDYKLMQDQHCWTLIKGNTVLYKEKE
ncbi:hypothetical protein MUB18_02350 [Sphingobacterium sp. PCS056]|jgi:hypothetical protein|uniref:hypothetical protein n=1 Tax=Sphingobacterium TaxID=28453 RepID=UPI00200E4D31|nr:hypothetical protein [Sphingobacterium sp. PCS056]UPZ37161.1 hypothetical protein MUB18_02350 [Sphingobacterium sp. PCS056]